MVRKKFSVGMFPFKYTISFIPISSFVVATFLLLIQCVRTESEDFMQKSLYKCAGNDIADDFLSLPRNLWIDYPEEKFDYFSNQFNASSLYNFSLVEHELECGSEVFSLEIPLLLVFNQPLSQVSPSFNFTPDGVLEYLHNDDEIYISSENYCISKITPSFMQVNVCKSQCGHQKEEKGSAVCIPKCCLFGQVLTVKGCQDALEEDWIPKIYPDVKSENPVENIIPQFQLNEYNFHWNCSTPDVQLKTRFIPNKDFKILSNGQIYTRKYGKKYWLPTFPGLGSSRTSKNFCVDGFWNVSLEGEYNPENSDVLLRICVPLTEGSAKEKEEKQYIEKLQQIYTKILFGITLVTSLIHTVTIWIYGTVSEQNVYGWTVLTFTFCQFLLNICICTIFGIFSFGSPASALVGNLHSLCIVIGVFHHFLLIASFSWTTVITYDVWSKLRSIAPRSRSSKGKKRFLLYCSFGLGVPMFIVFISVLMEFVISGRDSPDDNLIRPGYDTTCLIYDAWSYFYYVSIPIVILFVTNMLFALHTLKFLWEAKKSIKVIKDSHMTSSVQNKGSLIFKLFVLMGVFLSFEILLAFTSPIYVSQFFIVLDSFRIFHALGIFWVFVWNKKIRRQLASRYGKRKNNNKTTESNMQFTVIENTTVVPEKIPKE